MCTILETLAVMPPASPANSSKKMKRLPGSCASSAGDVERYLLAGCQLDDEGGDEEERSSEGAAEGHGAFASPEGAPPSGMHAAFQALLWFFPLPLPLPLPLPVGGFGQLAC